MSHDELLKQARAHWRECTEDQAERDNRERGREDAAFAAGKQWDERTELDRKLNGRPVLVFNRMPGFLHQVTNEARRNKIAITISPTDDGIDKDLAKVDQGLLRYIQYNSKADMATHAAFVEACHAGLGAFKLVGEYCDDDSFDNQDLKIEQIPDAINRVWMDPFAKELDRADARYCFEADLLSKEEYKAQFPDSEVTSTNFFDGGYGNLDHDWISENGVRVAIYWYIETRKRVKLKLTTGQTIYKDELEEDELPPNVVEKQRTVIEKKVKCAKLNGVEVLEEFEWPGSSIPVFLVVGEELYVNSQKKRFTLIHFAKDPQRLYNYYRSSEAEVVGLAPKAPYVAAEGQIEGYEDVWNSANTRPTSVLPYKPSTVAGQAVPPPQRAMYEPPIQALSLGASQASDDMKGATGMYDASLGARSNETSGRAIDARKAEGEMSNLHFISNFERAICACGRAAVEVKPFYYDTDRLIRILGEDEKPRIVRINAPYVDENGVKRHYDLTSAKYDVRVSTGPSFTTQRQEAWAAMTEWSRAYPQLLEIAGDIIFRNSDMPGADQIAERMKKTVPPALLESDEEGAAPNPEAMKAQVQQLTQQNEEMQAELAKAGEALSEMQSKERIEQLKVFGSLLQTLVQTGSKEGLDLLKHELDVLKQSALGPQGQGDVGQQYPVAA